MASFGEHDALVNGFSHLKGFPDEKEALFTLRKVASLVKPLMRGRGWRVNTLAEFFPEEDNSLLGINVNKGQKICLRLREPTNKKAFLPQEQVVDTMLHELAHIVYGPHNDDFQALWDQLREEYQGLITKGYTGEGFLSQGHVLGGNRIPRHEARRIAHAAAETRQTLYSGTVAADNQGGRRLGGAPPKRGQDIRKTIVNAIERRKVIMDGCAGSRDRNEKQVRDLADQATRHGYRTQADEDEANEAAIQEAMWELVQEDQEKKFGDLYIRTTPSNPTGSRARGGKASSSSKKPLFQDDYSSPTPRQPSHQNGYLSSSSSRPPSTSSSRPPSSASTCPSSTPSRTSSHSKDYAPPPSPSRPSSTSSRQPDYPPPSSSSSSRHPRKPSNHPSSPYSQKQQPPARNPIRPVSRLVLEAEAQKAKSKRSTPTQDYPDFSNSTPDAPSLTMPPMSEDGWTCPICTCHNPNNFLACDACTSERPAEVTMSIVDGRTMKNIRVDDRAGERMQSMGASGSGKKAGPPKGHWRCKQCAINVEDMWWTCTKCGRMKESS